MIYINTCTYICVYIYIYTCIWLQLLSLKSAPTRLGPQLRALEVLSIPNSQQKATGAVVKLLR